MYSFAFLGGAAPRRFAFPGHRFATASPYRADASPSWADASPFLAKLRGIAQEACARARRRAAATELRDLNGTDLL